MVSEWRRAPIQAADADECEAAQQECLRISGIGGWGYQGGRMGGTHPSLADVEAGAGQRSPGATAAAPSG